MALHAWKAIFVDGDFGLLSWIGKDGIAIGNSLVIHFRRL